MIKIKIVNVVATASLNQPINFEALRKHNEIFQNSNVYGGRVAYFKTSEMEGKISIFASGKMISDGTKSEVQAYKELEFAMKFIVDRGLAKATKLEPKTQNLVVVADFKKTINFEKMTECLRVIYEPEQFPGAILRITEPFKASILVFASGKTVVTGLKDPNQINPVIQHLKQLIAQNQ